MTTATQDKLIIEQAPTFTDMELPIAAILIEPWGSRPTKGLIDGIRTLGVIDPIIVESAGAQYRVVNGRRRVQAAVELGLNTIPARVKQTGDSDLLNPAMNLSLNGTAEGNPIVELQSIKALYHAAGGDLVAIARVTGMPLSLVKKRRELLALIAEMEDAWMDGKFENKIGEAIAKLDQEQQRRLIEPLRANDTLTAADVAKVKQTHVKAHPRNLPGMNWCAKAITTVETVLIEAGPELVEADDSETIDLMRRLIERLRAHLETE